MKSRMRVLVALMFSMLLLSVTVKAQGLMKPIADTGMLSIGPNQVLRVTVAAGDVNGDDLIRVRFGRMEYIEQDNVYRVASSNTSPPISLARGEAASIEIPNTGAGIRGVVLSNNPNVKVLGIVFDTSTQRISSICTFIPD